MKPRTNDLQNNNFVLLFEFLRFLASVYIGNFVVNNLAADVYCIYKKFKSIKTNISLLEIS